MRCRPRAGAATTTATSPSPTRCSRRWPATSARPRRSCSPPAPRQTTYAGSPTARPRSSVGCRATSSTTSCPEPGPRPADGTVQVHACHGAGPPGRGPARGAPRTARRRPDARAARHPGDVPRHRGLRTPDQRRLRARRGGGAAAIRAISCGCCWPTGRRPRPTRCSACSRRLLDLADGRAEATPGARPARDRPGAAPVRVQRPDLETMTTWATGAGVRWAWDQSGRARFGLADFPQNTWRFGLDRVLAGVALSDDSGLWIGPTLPLDDVSTTDISLAGRLAEAVDRLRGADRAAHRRATTVGQLARPAARRDRAARRRRPAARSGSSRPAHRELAALGREAATGSRLELRLSDVRALLHRQLAGRPTRANFRTGTLTVCTMTPDARGAAPGGLPARPRRRRLPARWFDRRRRRARPAAHGSASATSAARTGSSSSTRSCPPPSAW